MRVYGVPVAKLKRAATVYRGKRQLPTRFRSWRRSWLGKNVFPFASVRLLSVYVYESQPPKRRLPDSNCLNNTSAPVDQPFTGENSSPLRSGSSNGFGSSS